MYFPDAAVQGGGAEAGDGHEFAWAGVGGHGEERGVGEVYEGRVEEGEVRAVGGGLAEGCFEGGGNERGGGGRGGGQVVGREVGRERLSLLEIESARVAVKPRREFQSKQNLSQTKCPIHPRPIPSEI